ncbi:hypothetical protein [Streptomyces sp. WAC 04229]|uniref:hypothetical protein n=1 Tax=Streptomyces sp. WAC 04229 TaxID=2203206 RepID=UPI003D7292E0
MTALDQARKAAEAAASKLAAAEAAEAEKTAEAEAKRADRQRELDHQFLRDWLDVEATVRMSVTDDEKADAMEAGTLPVLLADYLAGRDASQSIRSHAQNCAVRRGADRVGIADVRDVDPVEELRRWQESALYTLKRRRAEHLAAKALAPYQAD